MNAIEKSNHHGKDHVKVFAKGRTTVQRDMKPPGCDQAADDQRRYPEFPSAHDTLDDRADAGDRHDDDNVIMTFRKL